MPSRLTDALSSLARRLRAFAAPPGEQDRIVADLRASEAKFSGILAIAADAIISVDDSERIIHFNQGAATIFGYTVEEAIGQPLDILLPHRVRDVHHLHMRRFSESPVQARRMGERGEIFGLRRDGTEFPAEASISKLIGPQGPLYTVVLRDITDRRRVEENERFLANAATQLVRSLDPTTVLQSIADLTVPRLADAAMVDVITPEGALRRAGGATPGSARELLMREIARAGLDWESPSPVIDVMRRGTTELIDGIDDDWIESHEELDRVAAWRTLGVHAMLVVPLMAGGSTLGALSLLMIDARRSFTPDMRTLAEKLAQPVALSLMNADLYTAAQRANRARDEVLGIVSHDLRNPLSAIAMCATALHDSVSLPPAGEQLIDTISESASTMNRLIQDLVDVASIERGQLSLERGEVRPERVVQRAMQMFAVEAAGHGIALTDAVAGELPLLHADEARLVQVLSNLLRNAIKFTPDGGRITVGAAAIEGGVRFSVSDTGAGIDPSLHERIFDRYWHDAAGARKRGTGLGLSIVRGIVEAHGGRLTVDSAIGSGSTFTFTVPATA